MALLTAAVENSAMSKRGPYKTGRDKAPPPSYRKNYLAHWRELRGWTQEELAEAAHMSVGMVSSVENATAGYSPESLHKLAAALGIDAGMVISSDPSADEPLWSIVARATPAERDQIAKHAAVIVGEKRTRRK